MSAEACIAIWKARFIDTVDGRRPIEPIEKLVLMRFAWSASDEGVVSQLTWKQCGLETCVSRPTVARVMARLRACPSDPKRRLKSCTEAGGRCSVHFGVLPVVELYTRTGNKWRRYHIKFELIFDGQLNSVEVSHRDLARYQGETSRGIRVRPVLNAINERKGESSSTLGEADSERTINSARSLGVNAEEKSEELHAVNGLLMAKLRRVDARLAGDIIADCRQVNREATLEVILFALSRVLTAGVPPRIGNANGFVRCQVRGIVRKEYLEALDNAAGARMREWRRSAGAGSETKH